MERTPHVTTTASHTTPSSTENCCGVARSLYVANSAPPSPATNALIPNATSFERATLMPSVAAAGSLERMASSSRPVVDRLRLRTTRATTTKHATSR